MEGSIINNLGFDPIYIIIAQAVLTFILLIAVMICIIKMRKLYRRYDYFMRGKDAESMEAVSYTHLDVYKRQVPYKSGRIDEELETGRKAIRALGGDIEEIIRFELAEAEADRALVVIKKVEKTGKRYPRKAGVPSKEPIG